MSISGITTKGFKHHFVNRPN